MDTLLSLFCLDWASNVSSHIALVYLTIGLYVSVRPSRYEVRGKFGEHERCVRVARGVTDGNFFFSRGLFADVMSVHHRNVKHARAIEICALCYKRN